MEEPSCATRICPCITPLNVNMDGELVMWYTGYKNEYFIKLNSRTCQCETKVATKEYLQFSLACEECIKNLKENNSIDIKEGRPEGHRKWINATWIHKELDLHEEILVAKPIPNSNNFVCLTSKDFTYYTYKFTLFKLISHLVNLLTDLFA